MRGGRQFIRVIVLFLVAGVHTLLFVLLSYSRPALRTAAAPGERGKAVLFLIESPPPTAGPSKSAQGVSAPPPTEKPGLRAILPAEEQPASAPAQDPQVDWRLEAQRAAQDMAPALTEQERRKCLNPEPPGLPPPHCRKRNYEADWEPEPKRVGVDGLLPYVRVGKRCVIGLGFFGCAVGKLPEADGDLFEDMTDPNRPRSSAPDTPSRERER